jgi:hypothetical protein
MTSDDRWTDMGDLDAELERLLSGGSPPADAPAWFGDLAVLVRTARAPARPDELAGEADIVARMVEVRLAVLDGAASDDAPAGPDDDEADAPPAPAVNGVTGVKGVNGHAHVDGIVPGAYAAADDESGADEREPLEDRLRERIAVSDLDEYRAKHGGERWYVAKHAAPPAEEPPHAVARAVGRVIAMKAVAITTAAVIGVAAAAAATTGIVANVVVPAFNDHYRRPVPTSESPDEHKDDEDEPGTSRSTRNPPSPVVSPQVTVTGPNTGASVGSPSITAPASTSTSAPADTTTSTTTSTTTTTSEPEPPSTTTPTTVAGDPTSLSP